MKALWAKHAEVRAFNSDVADAIDDLVSSVNVPPFETASILFPATQLPSKGATTLDDYREGLWTPIDVSGAGLALSILQAPQYVKIGRAVTASGAVVYPATASGLQATIGGLPFLLGKMSGGVAIGYQSNSVAMVWQSVLSTTTIRGWTSAGAALTNTQMASSTLYFTVTYLAAA